WPLVNQTGQIDPPNGWAEDERNWAVITAAQNWVDTAEQIGGAPRLDKILNPDGATNGVERAWHYFLASLNSGYMYYGTAEDLEVKPTIACNEALEHAKPVVGDKSLDATAPTIFLPQRHPYNPGSTNFGAQWKYVATKSNGDFWVWTFAYDVSGVTSCVLKVREDLDGVNPLSSNQNETYAGGSEVGAWESHAMNKRVFPMGNFFNDPTVDFFELPDEIADEYYVAVKDLRSVLVDYYIEATDGKNNVKRSPIQHVWIGDGAGGVGLVGDTPTTSTSRATFTPNPAVAGENLAITYDASSGSLGSAAAIYAHIGFNNWQNLITADPAMTKNATTGKWEYTLPVPQTATVVDVAFNDGANNWDNNGGVGVDWHVTVTGGTPPPGFVMDGALDSQAVQLSSAGSKLWAAREGDTLYVATQRSANNEDRFLYLAKQPGALQSANWVKAGQIAKWDAFIGDESGNTFAGWFDQKTGAQVQVAKGSTGGVLEGTINLADEYTTVPAQIYLAAAGFATADGGALNPASQSPASVNSDGNVDASEYVVFPLTTSTLAGDGNGDRAVNVADVITLINHLNGTHLITDQTLRNNLDLHDDSVLDTRDLDALTDLLLGR
ncbi:MAG: carbohydrate-binding protein, partial [bacterium]